jgi:hypothetical protein
MGWRTVIIGGLPGLKSIGALLHRYFNAAINIYLRIKQ